MKREKQFKARELRTLKNTIYEKTGVYIRNNCLLIQSFTRSSYSAEQGGENNEILEFIGDRILSYFAVKLISERYGALNNNLEYTFRVRENQFNGLTQALVSNENLAKIIDEWDIIEYLIVGKSDFTNGVDKQAKVKADLFEAILGAIAVASKWNYSVLEEAVRKMLSIDQKLNIIIETEHRPIKFDIENSINTLKELAEHGKCSIPIYEYRAGRDKERNSKWVCICTVITDTTGITRTVWASSKKAAKKAAAYLVLCDHFELQNEYGTNGKFGCWVYEDGKLIPEHLS